jgi:cystathionine beta-synthase
MVRRRHDRGDVVTVGPGDTLLTAYARMKLHDISQLPVLDAGRVVGIVDESDLLAAALHDEKALRGPVREIMSTRLHTVQVSTPPDQLLPLFRDGMVPIVFDGDLFYGLITRLDVVNHLRSKLRA